MIIRESVGLLLLFLCLLPSRTIQLNLDFCDSSLGLEHEDDLDGGDDLPDEAFTASSSYDDANVGPNKARLHFDSTSGGAWCPANPLSKENLGAEYLQIDLGDLKVITHALSQGRFGSGRGQEYAEFYTIKYWRSGMTDFKEYRDALGRAILPGNTNTYAVANNTLDPAIVASKIRILPYSEHPRTVCMRVGLLGCTFKESVVSYSIPQGMVRGSMLELMDHTYDGHEDSLTGDLRGGLGQLIDGRYGLDSFKGNSNNGGLIRGYDWVGWKRGEKPNVNLIFTFTSVRRFSRVDIHVNNHFTKDIQVFSKAKIYFSNEEDKFGDDRVVDFEYMPDLALENARNVSINLKGEHGKFVMVQLYFAAKWILVSELTFYSDPYTFPSASNILNSTNPASKPEVTNKEFRDLIKEQDNEGSIEVSKEQIPPNHVNIDFRPPSHADNADFFDDKSGSKQYASGHVGVVIGGLLTVIFILLGGILYVAYKNKKIGGSGKSTPTHSLLQRKFCDQSNSSSQQQNNSHQLQYTPYAKTSLYGYPSTSHTSNTPATQETIYEEPHAQQHLYAASGFLSINRKFSSDPVLSEATADDDDDEEEEEDYAEPAMIVVSNSFNEQIYASTSAVTANNPNTTPRPPLKPLPLSHYARPLTPPISARVSPPKYTRPGLTATTSAPPPIPPYISPSPNSTSTNRSPITYAPPAPPQTGAGGTPSSSSMEIAYYASTDLNKMMYKPQAPPPVSMMLPAAPEFKRSTSIDTVTVSLTEIERNRLRPLEKLGEGQFGEIHVCQLLTESSGVEIVAVKSLRTDSNSSSRGDFEQEARLLTSLNDPNLVSVLGVCFASDPMWMICEYSDKGDLCQFLQDHVAETTLSKSPGVPTLSYGCLIYIAAQIASGMKYLESLNFVHRDLATRNCLVGPHKSVKISDFGMSRSCYRNDYFKSHTGCLLPIRWMAWESVLMGKFTTKSDVWSFGVTLWEILTFAREQPYESASDEKVIANLSSLYKRPGSGVVAASILPTPHQCPREVRDLMTECWQREEKERPSFREIHLFLQRKNLGYDPKNDELGMTTEEDDDEEEEEVVPEDTASSTTEEPDIIDDEDDTEDEDTV